MQLNRVQKWSPGDEYTVKEMRFASLSHPSRNALNCFKSWDSRQWYICRDCLCCCAKITTKSSPDLTTWVPLCSQTTAYTDRHEYLVEASYTVIWGEIFYMYSADCRAARCNNRCCRDPVLSNGSTRAEWGPIASRFFFFSISLQVL
jgi:hypothetical protein